MGNGRRKGTAVQLGTTSSFQIPFRHISHEPIGFCFKKNGRTFRISKNKLVHKTPNFGTHFGNTISRVYWKRTEILQISNKSECTIQWYNGWKAAGKESYLLPTETQNSGRIFPKKVRKEYRFKKKHTKNGRMQMKSLSKNFTIQWAN